MVGQCTGEPVVIAPTMQEVTKKFLSEAQSPNTELCLTVTQLSSNMGWILRDI